MYCKEHNINPVYEDFLADIRKHISDADIADDYNFQYMNGINSEPEIIPTNTMADDVTGIGMNGGAYQGGKYSETEIKNIIDNLQGDGGPASRFSTK